MRVLITGAAGFIGSHLCELLAGEHLLFGVDNYLTGDARNWNADNVDITDRTSFYSIANDASPHLIVHCAASYSDPDAWHRDIDTNIAGMVNVCNVARHHGARVVYFQTALPPKSSYAISKLAAQQYLELSGVPWLTFRLANVYGPRNLSGPIPAFYRRLTAGEECTVVHATRDFVYVGDVCDFVLDRIDAGTEGVVDVGSGVQRTILEAYEHVAASVGSNARPRLVVAPNDDVGSLPVGASLADRPTVSFYEGVIRAVAWYREHGVEQAYTHLRVG